MISVDSERAIQNSAVELVFSREVIFVVIVYKLFFRYLSVSIFVHHIEGGSSVSSVSDVENNSSHP